MSSVCIGGEKKISYMKIQLDKLKAGTILDGKITKEDRLNGLLGDDGITNCGNAQNCIQVCPMSVPLTKAIYETNRDITVDALFGWLKK